MADLFCPPFMPMAEFLRDGEIGRYRLERFTITEEEATNHRARASAGFSYNPSYLQAGTYARLLRRDEKGSWQTVLVDTPDTRQSYMRCLQMAHGSVLLGGLKMGMLLLPLALSQDITSITVTEKDRDLIELICGQLTVLSDKPHVTVLNVDIHDWFPPGLYFDTIFFDLWDTVATSNGTEMARLHRRWCKRKKPDGWMSSWGKEEVQALKYGKDSARFRRRQWAIKARGVYRFPKTRQELSGKVNY